MLTRLYARGGITVALILAVIAIITVIMVMLIHKGSQPAYSPVTQPITLPSGVSVLVIGPPSFVEDVGRIIPVAESFSVDSIQESPAGSVVIVDWDYLVNQVGVKGAVSDLSILFKQNDFMIVYSNDSFLAAYELGRAWAMANGVNFTAIPAGVVGSFVAAFGDSKHLTYTSFNKPTELLGAIAKYLELKQSWQGTGQGYSFSPTRVLLQSNQQPTPDPCYQYGTQEGSSNGILFDYLPQYNGVTGEAYSDGNGTFYYDTCIFIYIYGIYYAADGTPSMDVVPAVWIAYVPSSTMVNNGGYINYYVGTIDHEKGYEAYEEGITNSHIDFAGGYSPGSASGESPLTVNINYENTGGATVNNTWTFTFSGYPNAGQTYSVAYMDDSAWMLTQGTNNENTALLGNEIGVNLVTSAQYYVCFDILNYEYMYVNFTWLLIYNPGQKPTYNATTHPTTSDPFITGITSYSQYIPIPCIG
ncbi:hypothetical protein [Caldivirga maquilingensis]|nr:hypothetical protein [Caldivirga maquilingensis]